MNKMMSVKYNFKFPLVLLGFCLLLAGCGPDRRISLAEQLMADRLTDSAVSVMQSIENPLRLSRRDYALYALLMAEASHRRGQLTAATDTLLLPAIQYFSQSGDSSYAERALYCKAHLERRLYRMDASMQSFIKALSFLQGRDDYEQLYRVNTWLGVVCMNQGDYASKVKYSKAALEAALNLGNVFYKNMALCDISTGYYFLNRQDSALHYAQEAYKAALADSVPRQLLHVYNNLGHIFAEMGQPDKALEYIDRSMAMRPSRDSIAIISLYTTKCDLFGQMGRYDSAVYYYRLSADCTVPSVQADALHYMSEIYHKMGNDREAYSLLARFMALSDTIREQRHTEEAIALQELYRHEQLAVENLYWRTQADRRWVDILYLTLAFLLLLWLVTIIGFLYRRSRRRVKLQLRRLYTQAEALEQERETSSRHLQRVVEMERKEACLKETFFRRLSQRVFQEIERGGNIILSDEDWDDIVQNANSIFDGFTGRLQQRYPALNKEDLRYCCMVKMQLSQAVMAQIMHLEKDSVKKRLKRIRTEKMGAEGGITLEDLLREF